ncbi:MAG TPA: bifunctional homocysteine S-methyltransferase/methylenetetrahydrofolate reductase [Planctomycetaceae bacterium]|nr:bifunctional homocysteine S-methyltransferase/methylenetetrahydrofolate reductase [Planctomycetaceae bacterium]
MSFTEALRSGVLVFDGPMGTELYRHHVFTNRCFEELNLSDSKLIERILTDYREAGAEVLTTNTFGANRPALEKYGLADKLADINFTGARIARTVADRGAEQGNGHGDDSTRRCFVAGSIGPILSSGSYNDEQIVAFFLEQIDPLLEGGADLIIFETFPSRAMVELAAKAVAHRPDTPYIISCAIDHGIWNIAGEPIGRLFAPLPAELRPPTAWGLNCGVGPDGILEALEEAVRVTRIPIVVQPNAGTPKEFEGRHIYYSSPEYVATYAMRFVNLGAAAVGGCCGIMPDHIREVVAMVKPLARGRETKSVLLSMEPEVEEKPESLFAERSRFACRLASKQWVTTVELVPPRGYDLEGTIRKCKMLHRHGIDAVNIPDGPRASSRISPMVVAQRIHREACIEPILHFCCRDRNLIGMQADLLACAASEIRNLLFVTGDPPKLGGYPHATGVFDTDSIGMCAVQRRLNRGVDLGGQSLEPPTQAVIGVGLDPTSLDRKRERDRFRAKIDNGAEFAITQPVFDPEALLRMLDEIGDCPIPIIAGVWPLAGYRNAVFMQNEVPGVVIPEATMKRMEEAAHTSQEHQWSVGVAIAKESIAVVQNRVAGVQVSAPFGRIEIALDVLT